MHKFSSKKVLLILAAIMFAIVFGRFFSLLVFPDSQTVLEKGELFQMKPETSLTQTFTANRNNLTKIEFLLRTPGLSGKDVVGMEIADETCSTTIQKGELEKSFLNSDNLYEFRFSKIPDSNGRKYCLKAVLQKNASSKYIRFFKQENSDPNFVLKDNDGAETKNQSLSMRLVYQNETLSQDLGELSQRISQYKPWFLKHYFLNTIVLLFVISSIILVAILIIV